MTEASNQKIAQAIHQLFVRRRMLERAGDIISILQKMVDASNGKIIAKLSSVKPLDPAMKKEVEKILTKRYGVKEVVLSEELNSKFLGGVRVEVNNDVIDLTFHDKIKKLKKYLTSPR